MMLNLFSIFDPTSSVGNMPLNWFSMAVGLFFIPYTYWTLPSRYQTLVILALKSLNNEISILLPQKKIFLSLVFTSLILMILLNNSLGLLPYVFTASSHLAFTLSLALPLWVAYFSYGWITNFTHMLAHLVPQGTPGALMPFMVLIESISSIIRPGTLSVRLAANMIAGHLLLALMSGAISIFSAAPGILILTSQVALLTLETAVAGIQAYVFGVLSALYASEV